MAGRLYPPIVNYTMPAFVPPTVRIYFAISSYNTLSEINSIQMTVRHLESNENALNSTCPGKVKVFNTIYTDPERGSQQDKYYVELDNEEIYRWGDKTQGIEIANLLEKKYQVRINYE